MAFFAALALPALQFIAPGRVRVFNFVVSGGLRYQILRFAQNDREGTLHQILRFAQNDKEGSQNDIRVTIDDVPSLSP